VDTTPVDVTVRDQSRATGTKNILLGLTVGVVGLGTVLSLVALAMILFRKRSPNGYERIPLLIDQ